MKVSIVSPVFNESKVIKTFINELCSVCEKQRINYEIYLVDDGSTDDTWKIISNLARKIPRLTAIRLMRNYGKDAALFVGLQNIKKTDFVITLDSDLQHPPQLLPDLLERITKGFEIVYAVKTSRPSESAFSTFMAKLLYGLLSKLHKDITCMKTDFMVFTNNMRLSILSFENRNFPLKGAILILNPKAAWVGYKPKNRLNERTRWTFSKKFALAIKLLFSFSAKPIALIFCTALVLFLVAIGLIFQVLYQVVTENALPGFATIIILQLISLASILFSLVIGFTYTYFTFQSAYLRKIVLIQDKTN